MNARCLGWLAAVGALASGCAAPRQVETRPLDTVLADWAVRTKPLQRMHFEGQAQVEWKDEQGDHTEQGDLAAWLDGDRRSSLRLTKFGDVYLWYGATPEQAWVFDFVSDPSSLRVGTPSDHTDAGSLAARPAVLRMLLGLDPWPIGATVHRDGDVLCVSGPAVGGHLEARLRAADLQPLTIAITFPDRGRLLADHRWTTGEVRVDEAAKARRLARVVDLRDASATVKIRINHAEALSAEQMDTRDTVFNLEKIKAHLQPELVK